MSYASVKLESKVLEFEYNFNQVQFNKNGKYFLRLTINNHHREDLLPQVKLEENNSKNFVSYREVRTNTVTWDGSEQSVSFNITSLRYIFPKGFCKNDNNYDVNLTIEAFATETAGRKFPQPTVVGEAKFAIYPRTDAPRANLLVPRGDNYYKYTGIITLLRPFTKSSISMHCGRISYSVAFREDTDATDREEEDNFKEPPKTKPQPLPRPRPSRRPQAAKPKKDEEKPPPPDENGKDENDEDQLSVVTTAGALRRVDGERCWSEVIRSELDLATSCQSEQWSDSSLSLTECELLTDSESDVSEAESLGCFVRVAVPSCGVELLHRSKSCPTVDVPEAHPARAPLMNQQQQSAKPGSEDAEEVRRSTKAAMEVEMITVTETDPDVANLSDFDDVFTPMSLAKPTAPAAPSTSIVEVKDFQVPVTVKRSQLKPLSRRSRRMANLNAAEGLRPQAGASGYPQPLLKADEPSNTIEQEKRKLQQEMLDWQQRMNQLKQKELERMRENEKAAQEMQIRKEKMELLKHKELLRKLELQAEKVEPHVSDDKVITGNKNQTKDRPELPNAPSSCSFGGQDLIQSARIVEITEQPLDDKPKETLPEKRLVMEDVSVQCDPPPQIEAAGPELATTEIQTEPLPEVVKPELVSTEMQTDNPPELMVAEVQTDPLPQSGVVEIQTDPPSVAHTTTSALSNPRDGEDKAAGAQEKFNITQPNLDLIKDILNFDERAAPEIANSLLESSLPNWYEFFERRNSGAKWSGAFPAKQRRKSEPKKRKPKPVTPVSKQRRVRTEPRKRNSSKQLQPMNSLEQEIDQILPKQSSPQPLESGMNNDNNNNVETVQKTSPQTSAPPPTPTPKALEVQVQTSDLCHPPVPRSPSPEMHSAKVQTRNRRHKVDTTQTRPEMKEISVGTVNNRSQQTELELNQRRLSDTAATVHFQDAALREPSETKRPHERLINDIKRQINDCDVMLQGLDADKKKEVLREILVSYLPKGSSKTYLPSNMLVGHKNPPENALGDADMRTMKELLDIFKRRKSGQYPVFTHRGLEFVDGTASAKIHQAPRRNSISFKGKEKTSTKTRYEPLLHKNERNSVGQSYAKRYSSPRLPYYRNVEQPTKHVYDEKYLSKLSKDQMEEDKFKELVYIKMRDQLLDDKRKNYQEIMDSKSKMMSNIYSRNNIGSSPHR